ncbi:MAG: TolC family protein [Sphingobacteriales bacterium]|nr:TolC family protein [Sphingobacteriales bacterium]
MKCYVLPFLLLAGFSATAQRLLPLEEAIATALENNYDIRLSKNDSQVAWLNNSYRNAALYPTLNANTGITFNNNDQLQKFSDGTTRERKGVKSSSLVASVSLNWTLFDGMKMFATRDKAAEFVKLGELGIKNQVVNTVADVINTYYNIARLKQQVKAIDEQISINEERVKLAEYKLDIGVGTKPDVLQSKVDLNAQKALKLEQMNAIDQQKEILNQLMYGTVANGKNNPSVFYEVSDSIPINTGLSLGEVQEGLESTNPLLLLAKKNMDIARLTLKERRAERFPTVAFNSNYNFSKSDNKAVVNPFQPLFSRNTGFNYGFTASIPIFNRFNVQRQIRQAQLDISYQQLLYDNQKSLISLNVINAYKDYEQQKKALALEEENIKLARENVNIVLQVYKLNSTTLIQLKEAQLSLQQAYNRLIAARYNARLAETELMRLKGELVK